MKYRIRVVRPLYETMVLDVEATDECKARIKAEVYAEHSEEDEWEPIWGKEGRPFALEAIDEAELKESPNEAEVATVLDATKFMTLYAHVSEAMGGVSVPEWFFKNPALNRTDILDDWISALEELKERSESDFLSELSSLRAEYLGEGVLTGVVPYPPKKH